MVKCIEEIMVMYRRQTEECGDLKWAERRVW